MRSSPEAWVLPNSHLLITHLPNTHLLIAHFLRTHLLLTHLLPLLAKSWTILRTSRKLLPSIQHLDAIILAVNLGREKYVRGLALKIPNKPVGGTKKAVSAGSQGIFL
jgi:hypothetical protein